MARSGKKQPLLLWCSAQSDGRDKRFIQIGNSLFLSKEFQALSCGARYLYFCMIDEAGGKKIFELPKKEFTKYGLSATSTRRNIKELVGAGFIKYQSGLTTRENNIYEFTTDWKRNTEYNFI